MEKQKEQEQERGCNCWYRYLLKLEDGGSQTTNRQPTTTTAVNATSWEGCGVIFVFVLVISFFLSVIYFFSSTIPRISSKVHSFSFSQTNSSSDITTNYDIVFSVHGTTGIYDYIHVDTAKASVFYGGQRMCDKVIDPFYVMNKVDKKIHMNMSAPLPQWVATDMAFQRSFNGILKFGFHIEAVGRFATAENVDGMKKLVEISCDVLNIGFSADFAATHLIKPPKKCRVYVSR